MAASQIAYRPYSLALLAGAWMATLTTCGLTAGTDGCDLPGHRLLGKWYNGIGNGQYIRFQFTDAGAYAYFGLFELDLGNVRDQQRQADAQAVGRSDRELHVSIRVHRKGQLLRIPDAAEQRDPARNALHARSDRSGAALQVTTVLRPLLAEPDNSLALRAATANGNGHRSPTCPETRIREHE